MSKDLWGFKDERELEKYVVDIPETILKEQMNNLGDKTGYNIYGVSSLMKIKNSQIGYDIATVFELMVPALDKYRKTLLIVYSKPESTYPVAITVGNSYEDDMALFKPQYTCDNTDEFTRALGEVLQSSDTLNLIAVLYAKSKAINNK